MKIIFNALRTNLGNTGGCKTIVESCLTLRKMGHECDIVASKNRYTWKKMKVLNAVPKCDVCIAVSVLDLDTTRGASADIKAFWLRGPEWEWLMERERAFKKMRGINVLCNSGWLVEYLKSQDIKSQLAYAGMDLEHWRDAGLKRNDTIGCLYSPRVTKMWHHFEQLADILGKDFQYLGFGLDKCKDKLLDGYLKNPSQEQLLAFYNRCKYWFSPSCLEGFHNPPSEAMACGSIVIANYVRTGGTMDYVSNKVSGIRYEDVEQAAKEIINLNNNPKQQDTFRMNGKERLELIGTREEAMTRLVNIIGGLK